MLEVRNTLGSYVITKYHELKSVIQQKGIKDSSQEGYKVDKDINLSKDQAILSGSKVDDNPVTPDLIKLVTQKAPVSTDIKSDVVEETFMERAMGHHLAITYNYLEKIAYDGWVSTTKLNETFDAQTGEKIICR
jgi:hypothetical protein